MKITHHSGIPYDLPSDFKLEMTRTNPFFHKMGEQSLPCSLPPTGRNLQILGYPDLVGNRKKVEDRINVTIENGSFFMRARQAILSAKRKTPIKTSFYMNEGAFYERVENLTLKDIFAEKYISFNTVDAAISFVFSLMRQNDNRFGCFMSITTDRVFNQVDHTNVNRFWHSIDRTEIVDEKNILVPRGMYITPFVKVRHVLEEVANFLGYTVDVSFMDTEPFNRMVFLNNNIDTIIHGRIDYVDVIPDLTLQEFFDIFRKFNHEIVPDESRKKLKLVSFNNTLNGSDVDLSSSLNGDLLVEYHNNYRQLRLTSNILNIPSDSTTNLPGYEINVENGFNTIDELSRQFPSARVDKTDGAIYRIGFKGESEVRERIGSLHCNYFSGGDIAEESKSFPDTLVEIIKSVFVTQASEGGAITGWNYVLYPYVGEKRAIRTKLVFDDEADTDNDIIPKSVELQKLPAMLCLYYLDNDLGFNTATIHNYNLSGQKLWNYSLSYNGEDGIFERFWRRYDDLLRNALLIVRGDMLLTENQKMMLSSYECVKLNSQKFIPSEIKYIPGENITQECTFLSTNLQEPVSHAKTLEEYFANYQYKWLLKSQRSFSFTPPAGTFEYIDFKFEPTTYFPNNPTVAQYQAGGKYFNMSYEVTYGYFTLFGGKTKVGEGTITTWLEPALYQ